MTTPEPVQGAVRRVHSLSQTGTERKAINEIYDFIFDNIADRDLDRIDAFLLALDESRLLPSGTISVLMATIPIAKDLRQRKSFIKRTLRWASAHWDVEEYKDVKQWLSR